MAQLHNDGKWFGPGEAAAARLLEAGLPASWHILCNKLLPAPTYAAPLYFELDFVIVGEHGVYVVDEKSWTGPISGTESVWRPDRTRHDLVSPVQIADRRAVVLRGALDRNDTRLKSIRPFARGFVLLSDDNDLSQLHAPIGKKAILFPRDVCTRLQQADAELDALRSSIAPYRERIVAYLLDKPRRQATPETFGDYRVVEELASPGPLRTFLARTPDGHERILRVILRAADSGDCEAKKNYLLREFAALEKLQSTDRVPRVHDLFSFQWTADYWVVPIELIDGQSLRRLREHAQRNESGGVMCAEGAEGVIRDAFRGLQEIHERGVLHRGLTPDRVHLRTADRRVIFSDFLIARAADGVTVAPTARDMDPGNIYWAPECLVRPDFAESATDVYGLAASLTYWLTGSEPGSTAESRWPPDVAASFPAQLGHEARLMLQRCLAEDIRDRPTVGEMIRVLSGEDAAARSPSPTPLAAGAVIDGYRVLKMLGSGGTADTWLADDQVSGRRWVLKVIRDPDLRERLARQEFDSLMELRSEYFPRVFAVKPAEHPYHLRIEYVEGDNLGSLLESRQGDTRFFERVSADLLAALEYLRVHGLIHRDVSAANILVPASESEPVRLIDFGMATSEKDSRSAVGTRPYMPPEIERGERGWSHQGDLYSAAVLLFQLLTGRMPYEVTQDGRRKDRLVPPLADERARYGGERLAGLLRACESDPSRRPASATELAQVMQEAPSPPRRRKRPLVWAFAAVAVVACLALVLVGMRLFGEDRSSGSTVTWSQAAQLVDDGRVHTVTGPVSSMLRSGESVYLSVGKPYPDPERFTIKLAAPADSVTSADFAKFLGAEVEATGQVVSIGDGAGVELQAPADVTIRRPGPPIIDWSEAKHHEGEIGVVTGSLLRTRVRRDRPGQMTYLDINRRYPSEDRFTIKMAPDDRAHFLDLMGMTDFSSWAGKTVWVRGRIEQADQETTEFVPQVTVNPLTDIWVGD